VIRCFLLVFLVGIGCPQDVISQDVFKIGNSKIVLEDGDIIFRSGVGKDSEFIRDFATFDKTFTHAGLLLKEGNRFYVYHMLGGDANFRGGLKKDPIMTFVCYPENECFGIYRLPLTTVQRRRIRNYIDSLGRNKPAFDMNFRIGNKDSLYCTEMVVEAIKYASGGNLCVQPQPVDLSKTKYRNILGRNQQVVWFYSVERLQHAAFLEKKIIIFYPNYKAKQTNRK